ncbi:hypothetical protein D3C79_864350 [compost metagenome]
MAIGLGRRHQRPQHRLAVQLGLGRRQAVEGLWLGGGHLLARLPVAVGLVGQHTERGQAAIGEGLAAIFAGFLVAQQQTHGARRQGAATGTGKQAAKAAGTGAWLARAALAGLAGEQVLAGLEQLVEQSPGIHQTVSTLAKGAVRLSPARPIAMGGFASGCCIGWQKAN